jgi:TolB-like protein
VAEIFLSYNREDQTVAKAFAQALEQAGYKVWWDTTLRAGETYDEVTEAALRGASAVVVLWSKKSVASRWVRAEALLAHRLNTLVPCMIEPCERPIMFELTHTADLTGWNGDLTDPRWMSYLTDIKSFTGTDRTIGASKAIQNGAPVTPPKAPINRRGFFLAGSGVAVAIAAVGMWAGRDSIPRLSGAKQGDNSIAVLPFINISGDASQTYFADGLSAEVRAELANNPQLRVVASSSSAMFKERSSTAQAMAKQLGVAFLLDGNVRKANNNARVNTELIDAKSGVSIWGHTFDRPLDDIFAVQSEIAMAVVSALIAKLPVEKSNGKKLTSSKSTAQGGTRNVAAYENFLRGRALFESALSVQTDRDALAAYDSAIALDPNYAAPHAFRARVLSVLGNQSGDPNLMRIKQREALAAAQRAVELAPQYADAHSALGFVLFIANLDVRGAKPAFDKSLQYGSGDGDVLTGFAMFSARTGARTEAARAIQQAIERDPLNPTVFRCAGQIAAMARNYEQAISYYDRTLTMSPKSSTTNALKGMALFHSGRLDQARAAFAIESYKNFALPGLAIIDQKQGRSNNAKAALATLISEFGDIALYQQAEIHAGWGDKQTALSTLERAYVVGDSGLASLYTDPLFDDIRNEGRFIQLLKSIGFA